MTDYQYLRDTIAGHESRIRALEQASRSASTMLYDDCRITITWEVPDPVDTWIDDSFGVSVRIGVDDLGNEQSVHTVQQHPAVGSAELTWRDVGIESAGTWWISAAIDATGYKVDGNTILIHWQPKRWGRIPESQRIVTRSLGAFVPIGTA